MQKESKKKEIAAVFSTNKKNVITKKKCVKKICLRFKCVQAEILHEKHLSYYKKEKRIKITKLSFRREK